MNTEQENVSSKQLKLTKNDLSIFELVQVVLFHKWKVCLFAFFCGILSIFLALSLPDIYKSEVLLSPVVDDSSSNIDSQLGGLASLAGISLDQGNLKSKLALEVLSSKQFVNNFVKKHQFEPQIMAVEYWVRENNYFVYNPEKYDPDTKTWYRKEKQYLGPEPTVTEIHQEFLSLISINEDEGFIKISFSHFSPFFSKRVLELIVDEINLTIKLRDIEEAKKSITYLNKQIENSQVAEVRTMLLNLIEKQVKKIMLAEARDEYVFTVIDPAIVADHKFKPKRALIVILGIFSGGFLAIVFFIVRRLINVK